VVVSVDGDSPEPHPITSATPTHEIGKNLMREKSPRRFLKSRLIHQKADAPT